MNEPGTTRSRALLLPDFCSAPAVLAVVLCAELAAALLLLLRPADAQDLWFGFGPISLFLLWVGLGSAALLCALRSALARLPFSAALLLALAVLLAVVALVSGVAIALSTSQSLPMPQRLQIPPPRLDFLLRNLAIATLLGAMGFPYAALARRWYRSAERAAERELIALKLRLPPRLLAATLEDMSALIAASPGQALYALQDLTALVRANEASTQGTVAMGTALEIAHSYLRLRQLRLGEPLHVIWDIPDLPLAARTPAQLLQLLLHLAVEGGIAPRGGGIVTISGAVEAGIVGLSVRAPLAEAPELSPEWALEPLRAQLQALWPGQCSLEGERSSDEYCVRARWPLELLPAH
jgi:two-component system sensor histidine kinase AlgZ